MLMLGLAFVVGSFLAVAAHEVGHAITAAVVGFSVRSLRVGPFQIDLPFRISLVRAGNTPAVGWAAMIPGDAHALTLRLVACILAAPAANLLAGFVTLRGPFSPGPFSSMFAFNSLLIGFLNLIPLQHGIERTDGKRILELLNSPERRERLIALTSLVAQINKGVPAQDLSSDLLAKATAIKDDSVETVVAHSLAYNTAYFRHDDLRTAEYLEICLQYWSYAPLNLQHELMSDAGIFQARRRKRVDLAEQWMNDLPGKTEPPWLRTTVEVAILEAKGDFEGAVERLESIEGLTLAIPGLVRRERSHRYLLQWKSDLVSQIATFKGD